MQPWASVSTPFNQEFMFNGDPRFGLDGVGYVSLLNTLDAMIVQLGSTYREQLAVIQSLELPWTFWAPKQLPVRLAEQGNLDNDLEWFAFANHGLLMPARIYTGSGSGIYGINYANPNDYSFAWYMGQKQLMHYIFARHEFTINNALVSFPGLFPQWGVASAAFDAWALAAYPVYPSFMLWDGVTFLSNGDPLILTSLNQSVSGAIIPRLERYAADMGLPMTATVMVGADFTTGVWTPPYSGGSLNDFRTAPGYFTERWKPADLTGVDYTGVDGIQDRYTKSILEYTGVKFFG
jgi:hypothetical protein